MADKSKLTSWYHNAGVEADDVDPDIKDFADESDALIERFNFGPFDSFEAARQDFLEHCQIRIDLEKIRAARVRRLRNPEKERKS